MGIHRRRQILPCRGSIGTADTVGTAQILETCALRIRGSGTDGGATRGSRPCGAIIRRMLYLVVTDRKRTRHRIGPAEVNGTFVRYVVGRIGSVSTECRGSLRGLALQRDEEISRRLGSAVVLKVVTRRSCAGGR